MLTAVLPQLLPRLPRWQSCCPAISPLLVMKAMPPLPSILLPWSQVQGHPAAFPPLVQPQPQTLLLPLWREGLIRHCPQR